MYSLPEWPKDISDDGGTPDALTLLILRFIRYFGEIHHSHILVN
jgi:hypothetical protein